MIDGQAIRVHMVVVGIKGDWPFLRKSCHLKTGYNASRKCHICESLDPWQEFGANLIAIVIS